jgi:hypothetical protein
MNKLFRQPVAIQAWTTMFRSLALKHHVGPWVNDAESPEKKTDWLNDID